MLSSSNAADGINSVVEERMAVANLRDEAQAARDAVIADQDKLDRLPSDAPDAGDSLIADADGNYQHTNFDIEHLDKYNHPVLERIFKIGEDTVDGDITTTPVSWVTESPVRAAEGTTNEHAVGSFVDKIEGVLTHSPTASNPYVLRWSWFFSDERAQRVVRWMGLVFGELSATTLSAISVSIPGDDNPTDTTGSLRASTVQIIPQSAATRPLYEIRTDITITQGDYEEFKRSGKVSSVLRTQVPGDPDSQIINQALAVQLNPDLISDDFSKIRRSAGWLYARELGTRVAFEVGDPSSGSTYTRFRVVNPTSAYWQYNSVLEVLAHIEGGAFGPPGAREYNTKFTWVGVKLPKWDYLPVLSGAEAYGVDFPLVHQAELDGIPEPDFVFPSGGGIYKHTAFDGEWVFFVRQGRIARNVTSDETAGLTDEQVRALRFNRIADPNQSDDDQFLIALEDHFLQHISEDTLFTFALKGRFSFSLRGENGVALPLSATPKVRQALSEVIVPFHLENRGVQSGGIYDGMTHLRFAEDDETRSEEHKRGRAGRPVTHELSYVNLFVGNGKVYFEAGSLHRDFSTPNVWKRLSMAGEKS